MLCCLSCLCCSKLLVVMPHSHSSSNKATQQLVQGMHNSHSNRLGTVLQHSLSKQLLGMGSSRVLTQPRQLTSSHSSSKHSKAHMVAPVPTSSSSSLLQPAISSQLPQQVMVLLPLLKRDTALALLQLVHTDLLQLAMVPQGQQQHLQQQGISRQHSSSSMAVQPSRATGALLSSMGPAAPPQLSSMGRPAQLSRATELQRSSTGVQQGSMVLVLVSMAAPLLLVNTGPAQLLANMAAPQPQGLLLRRRRTPRLLTPTQMQGRQRGTRSGRLHRHSMERTVAQVRRTGLRARLGCTAPATEASTARHRQVRAQAMVPPQGVTGRRLQLEQRGQDTEHTALQLQQLPGMELEQQAALGLGMVGRVQGQQRVMVGWLANTVLLNMVGLQVLLELLLVVLVRQVLTQARANTEPCPHPLLLVRLGGAQVRYMHTRAGITRCWRRRGLFNYD